MQHLAGQSLRDDPPLRGVSRSKFPLKGECLLATARLLLFTHHNFAVMDSIVLTGGLRPPDPLLRVLPPSGYYQWSYPWLRPTPRSVQVF
jgi:hypothetical protein